MQSCHRTLQSMLTFAVLMIDYILETTRISAATVSNSSLKYNSTCIFSMAIARCKRKEISAIVYVVSHGNILQNLHYKEL